MNVFGVRGFLLNLKVSEKFLDLLFECTSKSVETMQRLVSEDNLKKLHEVKRFDIQILMQNLDSSRKKVVPEVLHVLRHSSLER